MASTPSFIATGVVGVAALSAANTALDGTGTITTLVTGAATGTRILEVDVKCAATSAAAVVNVFVTTDGGTTWRLFDSIMVTAVTASNTVPSFSAQKFYDNLVLPAATHRIGVTTTIAQATNVIAMGGDL